MAGASCSLSPLVEVVAQADEREGDYHDADVAVGGEAAVVGFLGEGLVGPGDVVLIFGEAAEGAGDEALFGARIGAGGADVAAAEKERAGGIQDQGAADNPAETFLSLAELAQELIEPAVARHRSFELFSSRRFHAKQLLYSSGQDHLTNPLHAA